MWRRNKEKVKQAKKSKIDQVDFQRSESGKGGRNLVIMGVVATAIALCTTSVSLAIYHNSGDIYLDRSRPGFLPDEQEIEDESVQVEDEYELQKSGSITEEDLNEFIENLNKEIQSVDAYESPFGAKAMSDEWLDISVEEEKVGE